MKHNYNLSSLFIEPSVRHHIQDNQFMVMRDRSGKAIDVSFTEDGLRWVMDRNSRLLYYRNAYLKVRKPGDSEDTPMWYIVGDTRKNPNITIEKFVPKDHIYIGEDGRLVSGGDKSAKQKAEKLRIKKAQCLLKIQTREARAMLGA